MIKTCAFCDQKFTALRSTAKFCSPACKLKFNRGHETKKQNPQVPPAMPSTEEVVKIAEKVLKSQTKRVCVRCGEKFTSGLELPKFCSPACKQEIMVVIAEGPHKNYLKSQQS